MPKSETGKLSDSIRDAEEAFAAADAALELQRDRAFELYESLDRLLRDLREGRSGGPLPFVPREGPLRYAHLSRTHQAIDVILMYLDHAGPHTEEEIAKEIVAGGFYRELGKAKKPGTPGGPGSAERQVEKSIEYHLLTVAEKRSRYGARGKKMNIDPPKLRKMMLSGNQPSDVRELIGRSEWTDDEFRKRLAR